MIIKHTKSIFIAFLGFALVSCNITSDNKNARIETSIKNVQITSSLRSYNECIEDGMRSNYQIGIINGENREFGKCDIEISNKIVEPTERIRGDFARTYLYMQNAYPNYIKFNNNIQKLIKKWDKDDPVDDWECLRAKKIKEFQGNLNIILHQRCLNKDTKNIQNKKNNLKIKSQSKNLIKENENIKYSKTKSNKGSFNGKGTHDALK